MQTVQKLMKGGGAKRNQKLWLLQKWPLLHCCLASQASVWSMREKV